MMLANYDSVLSFWEHEDMLIKVKIHAISDHPKRHNKG